MKRSSSSSGGFGWIIGGFSLIVVVIIIIAVSSSNSVSGKTTREVALSCTTDMATQFHIHPKLKIIINGTKEQIPAGVGILPTCMNSLHVHDADDVIHVESPEQRDFTLADFFAVWNKPFSANQILDFKTDAEHKIIVTVNSKPSSDFENLILKDEDEIVIEYREKK